MEHLLVAGTHDTLLLFTDAGKVFWLRTFELPQGGRASRGKPIVNLLPALGNDERITAILRLDAEMVRQQKAAGVETEADEDDVIDADEVIDETVDGDEAEAVVDTVPGPFIFMATSSGIVKRTALANFARPRSSGLIAVKLQEGEHLVNVAITHGDEDVMLVARNGKAVRFHQCKVRVMSRLARGVRGIKLAEGVDVISLIVPQEEGQILTASENGYGKRTPLTEYPTKGRGGQGVIAMVINERNGELVGATQVFGGEDIMLISNQGTLVRTGVDQISTSGRNTQGVRLIRLGEGEKLCGLATIPELEGVEEEEGEDGEVIEGETPPEAPESDASDDAEE